MNFLTWLTQVNYWHQLAHIWEQLYTKTIYFVIIKSSVKYLIKRILVNKFKYFFRNMLNTILDVYLLENQILLHEYVIFINKQNYLSYFWLLVDYH